MTMYIQNHIAMKPDSRSGNIVCSRLQESTKEVGKWTAELNGNVSILHVHFLRKLYILYEMFTFN